MSHGRQTTTFVNSRAINMRSLPISPRPRRSTCTVSRARRRTTGRRRVHPRRQTADRAGARRGRHITDRGRASRRLSLGCRGYEADRPRWGCHRRSSCSCACLVSDVDQELEVGMKGIAMDVPSSPWSPTPQSVTSRSAWAGCRSVCLMCGLAVSACSRAGSAALPL